MWKIVLLLIELFISAIMCSSSSKLAWTKSAGGDSSNNLSLFQQDCRIVGIFIELLINATIVAVEKLITIPGCIPVRVQLNACRGYCLSWTVPDGRRTVASYAMCCRMVERELSTKKLLVNKRVPVGDSQRDVVRLMEW
ncbi:hypothetical protein T02_2288 [Trichinella nativa]|uniref:DAN domain-containing protein n=1 Tax=Trichinella nativa TaxID=6335 RepID=A0A0V1L7V5_9BILA|nr:hypothetical protein T02_2288 [Trichinella nativa]